MTIAEGHGFDDETLRTLRRTHIAGRDFESAGEFIGAARKYTAADVEYAALMMMAIICYTRPFTSNEARAETNPQTDQSLRVDAAALLGADFGLHDRLLPLRHKAIAHAEYQHYPVDPTPIHELPATATGISLTSRSWHVANENINLDAFARIAESMRRLCMNRISDFAHSRRLIDLSATPHVSAAE